MRLNRKTLILLLLCLGILGLVAKATIQSALALTPGASLIQDDPGDDEPWPEDPEDPEPSPTPEEPEE